MEIERFEREAAELLTVAAPFELSLGEVVPDGGAVKQALIRDTLENPTQCALEASDMGCIATEGKPSKFGKNAVSGVRRCECYAG